MPSTTYFLAGNEESSTCALSNFAVLTASDKDTVVTKATEALYDTLASYEVETWAIDANGVVTSKHQHGMLAPGMTFTGLKHHQAQGVALTSIGQLLFLGTDAARTGASGGSRRHAQSLGIGDDEAPNAARFVVTGQVGNNRYIVNKLQRFGLNASNKGNRVVVHAKQQDDLQQYRIAKNIGFPLPHVTSIKLLGYAVHDVAMIPTRDMLRGLHLPIAFEAASDTRVLLTSQYATSQNGLVPGHDVSIHGGSAVDSTGHGGTSDDTADVTNFQYVYDDYYVLRIHGQAEGKCRTQSNDDRIDGAFYIIPLSTTQAQDHRNGNTQTFSQFEWNHGLVTHTFEHGELPMLHQLFFTLTAPNGDKAPCGRLHLWLQIEHS